MTSLLYWRTAWRSFSLYRRCRLPSEDLWQYRDQQKNDQYYEEDFFHRVQCGLFG